MIFYKIILCLLFDCFISFTNGDEEIFKQNIGKDIQIDIPEAGYKSVKLKCGSDSMHVDLETENDFSGVIYTRGSFYDKGTPCFLDPGSKRGQRSFTLQFPLDKCKTLQKGEVYSNVLVVQNDKELIMPGDAAFNLECDFRQPRNITVNADLQRSSTIVSKITVTNPDLGSEENHRQKRDSAESSSDTVELKCEWPQLDPKNEDPSIETTNEEPLRALIISDTHLSGPIRGNWVEKLFLERQMYHMFQIAVKLHKPEVVFVLGDLIDEGEYASVREFDNYVNNFYNLFTVPEHTQMYIIVGNHDIGFHYTIQPHLTERFAEKFKSPYVEFVTIRNNHFVLVNSIGFEGDACFLCNTTEYQVAEIENKLKCTKGEISCDTKAKLKMYSKPILMQHFPLYRKSDENCSEPDEAPYPDKIEKFKEAWDCLSKNATEKLLQQIEPRLVICGHTHHGCTTTLPDGEGVEITLPSFNWKHKNNPSYGLFVITPNNYSFSKCLMPRQSSALIRYITAGLCLILGLVYWYRRSKQRKPRYFFVA